MRLVNLWHAVFLALWSVWWMSAAMVACVLTGRADTALRWARTRWSPGLFSACGVRVRVDGLEHLDGQASCVFVANHQSMIDIPALFVALPRNLHFLAKKELFSIPFLGGYMRASGMIPIDRDNGTESVALLRRSADLVAHGASVLAFAEGTRSRTGAIAPFKKGAFMLAIQAGVPVVPVAIEGARKALAPDGFVVRPEEIRIRVGRPIPTAGMTASDRDRLITQAHADVVSMNVALGGIGAEAPTLAFHHAPNRGSGGALRA